MSLSSQFIYIRVCVDHIQATVTGSNQSTPSGQQSPSLDLQSPPLGQQSSGSSGHLYFIKGSFGDIAQYAGNTVDWIIRIAHLLCNPLGTGHIFTHTTGTSSDWYSSDRTPSWQEVVYGDQLLPGIYEFKAAHPFILYKIGNQPSHSMTTLGSEANSSALHRHVLHCDAACVVTGYSMPVRVSHLIPRCIGSEGARAIVEQFFGETEATSIHQYNSRIGMALVLSLDIWVVLYEAGFYHISVSNQTAIAIVYCIA